MLFTSRFGKLFIFLSLLIPLMTVSSIYMYQKYRGTTQEIDQLIYNDHISDKRVLFDNIVAYMRNELDTHPFGFIHSQPGLRAHFEHDMHAFVTDDLRFLYILYWDEKTGKFRYLLDSTVNEDERAEYGQKFDPQSDIWQLALQTKAPQIEHQQLETLWITYALPIIENGEVVAILGADFSHEIQKHIDEAIQPLNQLFFYNVSFILIMLLTAYIQIVMYYLNRKKSLHDPLTGVYNRQYLSELLNSIDLRDYQILLIDLDHFKRINDVFGHDVGDIVLEAASSRIRAQIRSDDVLIRYGGEEFLLLLNDKNLVTSKRIADRIQEAIQERSIRAGEHTVSLTLSIGVNPYPGYAKNFDEAVKIADEQLYKAKSSGRNRVEISDDEVRSDQSHSTKRIQDVKDALLEDRIRLMYQPIFRREDHQIQKYEVLVRLVEPDNRIVTPDNFLPAIANTQVYIKLTKRILELTLQTLEAHPAIEISMNLALQDVFNSDIMAIITSKLMTHSDLTRRITFEILETEEITNFEMIHKRINILKSLGVKIALDDFGSGYANFNYLIHLGIDTLKIDGSLIRGIDENENAYHIVQTINDFAKRMGIVTIAEQIETESELKVVEELEVDCLQGYYLGRPGFDLLDKAD